VKTDPDILSFETFIRNQLRILRKTYLEIEYRRIDFSTHLISVFRSEAKQGQREELTLKSKKGWKTENRRLTEEEN